MAIKNYKYTARLGVKTFASTLALAGAIASVGVVAQETEEATVEEVLVTGQRASLQNAQEIKRDSNTFVDAISAADIGALPDRSVLEALQRLPGVSVERFASSEDPDHFSGEGSGAVVRGMTATRTEFNGRDSFTANSGRGLSWGDVSPELMGSVKLYKNQTADMIEGGIGGTVSLHTRNPFDSEGQVVAFSVDNTYFDLSEEWEPSYSGLYSNRWETGVGEFGLLISGAKGKTTTRTDGVQASYFYGQDNTDGRFNSSADTVYFPSGAAIDTKEDKRTREGYAVSVQWANTDETVLATGTFIRSDSTLSWTEQRIANKPFDDKDGRFTAPAEGTQFTFDDNGVFNSGILAHANEGWRTARLPGEGEAGSWDGYRVPTGVGTDSNCFSGDPELEAAEDDCNERSLTYGQFTENSTKMQTVNTLVDDYAFNVKFTPNDNWEYEADFQYVDAQSDTVYGSLNLGTWMLADFDLSGDVPTVGYLNPWTAVSEETINNLATTEAELEGSIPIDRLNGNYFSETSSYWWDNASDHYEAAQGEEIAVRFDVTHTMDGNFFKAVKMGVRYSERQQEVYSVDYSNWGALSGMRAFDINSGDETGYVAAWADQAMLGDTEEHDWSDFYRGDGTFAGIQGADAENAYITLHPSAVLTSRIDAWGTLLSGAVFEGNARHWRPASQRDTNRDGVIDAQGHYLPEELSDIKEVNQAAYVRLDFESEFHGFDVSGNFGLRYFQVDLESSGFTRFPDLRPIYPDREANSALYLSDTFNFLSADESGFGNAAVVLTQAENSYSDVLPSFNVKVEFTEELLGRFAVSKAVSLPDIGDLRSYLKIDASVTSEDVVRDDPNDGLAVREVESASVRSWSASAGNPGLLPMESIQYDASLEWYFADVGSLTGSIFYKDLSNFFVDGAFPRDVTNPVSGVTQEVNVGGIINGGDGSLQGFEFAYQQFFDMLPAPFDGLGLQANYTFIDVNGVPNPALEGDGQLQSDEVAATLPLQSQSEHTANIVLMYEKGDLAMRAAYNWRSEYLVTARDASNLPYPATWAGDSGYLDASIFYNITDEIKIGLQGTNLTNTVATTKFQNLQNTDTNDRSWFINDRRYSVVVRGTF